MVACLRRSQGLCVCLQACVFLADGGQSKCRAASGLVPRFSYGSDESLLSRINCSQNLKLLSASCHVLWSFKASSVSTKVLGP
jgi:hypothetical protein